MNRIPASYAHARFRSSTPLEQNHQQLGLSFCVDGERVIRLRLSLSDAQVMIATIQGFLTEFHSGSSLGIPSVDVSGTSAMENVLPPAKSSAAISGVA